ncbi:hypothetical protein EV421DRAFT_1748748, partial [Armillaria borealis]
MTPVTLRINHHHQRCPTAALRAHQPQLPAVSYCCTRGYAGAFPLKYRPDVAQTPWGHGRATWNATAWAVHGITPGSNAARVVALWDALPRPLQAKPFLFCMVSSMIWMLRSARSGRAFNPYTADDPHLPAVNIRRAVSPIRVDIDVADLIQEVVRLENAHSLKDDLDELDDIHIMSECHPPAPPLTPLTTPGSKRAAESSATEEL